MRSGLLQQVAKDELPAQQPAILDPGRVQTAIPPRPAIRRLLGTNVSIKPGRSSVQGLSDLFGADLVIDATGEEMVSELINSMRLDSGADTPVLHVRIRGNGECVQRFWAQGRQLGCFRCLLQADHKNYRQERFPVLKEQPKRKRLGCNRFTPYAVSAPMAAAALFMEAVVDWLQSGRASPRYQNQRNSQRECLRRREPGRVEIGHLSRVWASQCLSRCRSGAAMRCC